MHCFVLGSGAMERFLAIGLPAYLAVDLAREVEKYVANSGPAWTVSRLKSIKLDIIRERAGLSCLTWVRKNRSGRWYGIWGSLRAYAKKSDRCFNRVINALMVYSGFEPNSPTSAHKEKFLRSVNAPKSFIPNEMIEDIQNHTRKAGLSVKRIGFQDYTPLIFFQGNPSKRAPVWGASSVPQNSDLHMELELLKDDPTRNFIRDNWENYFPVFHGLRRKDVLSGEPGWLSHPVEGCIPHGGRVAPLTKDGGWKVRWVASPHRIHQLALQPLGNRLYSLLKCLPWDCTFDQDKAIPTIQKHLQKGKTIHAVDLSAATDYFPLELQMGVLRQLSHGFGWESSIHLFESLARARWTSPYGEVRWTKGQPMGLYPSFASFALTHGILLDFLSGHPGQFFVLGDDVVILDDLLYERYVKTLDLLECPHEPSKTISSNRLTEFAGKIITPNNVIPQFKWRRVSSKNFLDLMRNFGQQFSTQLSRRELAVYEQVAELLPPYGCAHSLGPACGMKSAIERTDEFESRLQDGGRRKFNMSFLGFLTRNLEPGKKGSLWNHLQHIAIRRLERAFDEKVSTALSSTAFPFFKGDATAVSDTLESVGCYPDLPADVPRRVVQERTTLELYEGWLGIVPKQ